MQESSLRTNRATIRNGTLPPPLQVGIPRAPKSRVDDRIKKRMSMRYADLVVSPSSNEPVPPLPGFPIGIGEGGERLSRFSMMGGDEDVRVRMEATTVEDDKKMLDDEKFSPDIFLKAKLANSTEAQLKSLQSSLKNAKEDTNTELQRNVFKNYAEFVHISKEITSLETEMLELKDLLSEYKYMPFLLHIPDPTMQSSNPNIISTYRRSSVADLRVMYHNQMQDLHSTVEGSAKFAPTTPGRHIVSEADGIMSLNAATYKVIGHVRFFILDDLVLVARRRRRKAANVDGSGGGGTVNEGKLVAERCWPLNEMLVLDTKDSPRMTNVFKIRHGKETYVFRTEQPQNKKALLQQFRQVAEELAAKKRKEREGEHERRKSLWQTGSGGGNRSSIPPMPEWIADLAGKGGEILGIDPDMDTGAKQKAERDARWTAEWADGLTVAIALREWEKAVNLVEEGKAKCSVIPPLAHKLPPLNSLLISSLLQALSHPNIRKSAAVSIISYLCRLKAGHAARDAFLQMRTKVLERHVRMIKFDGNITNYIGELAVVYFTGIKHTADWFLASFKENEVASAFIGWAKGRIEDFAEKFRNQVFTSDANPEVIQDSLAITHSQSRKLLQEYGLDFRHMFDGLLVKDPKPGAQPIPQFTLQDPPPVPILRSAPPPRRRTPAQALEATSSSSPSSRPPALQIDSLAPPPSAMRSGHLSPAKTRDGRPTPLLSAPGSGYSPASHYSTASPVAPDGIPPVSASFAVPARENTRSPGAFSGGTVPLRTPQSGAIPSALRPRTPASANPPSRARTPISAAHPSSRPHTPILAVLPPPGTPPRSRTPGSAAPSPVPTLEQQGQVDWERVKEARQYLQRRPTVDGPTSRPGTRDREIEREKASGERQWETEEERDRNPPLRPMGKTPTVPPRSVRRPGSNDISLRPTVPPREGMF